jgi:hypothetical protein
MSRKGKKEGEESGRRVNNGFGKSTMGRSMIRRSTIGKSTIERSPIRKSTGYRLFFARKENRPGVTSFLAMAILVPAIDRIPFMERGTRGSPKY